MTLKLQNLLTNSVTTKMYQEPITDMVFAFSGVVFMTDFAFLSSFSFTEI